MRWIKIKYTKNALQSHAHRQTINGNEKNNNNMYMYIYIYIVLSYICHAFILTTFSVAISILGVAISSISSNDKNRL